MKNRKHGSSGNLPRPSVDRGKSTLLTNQGVGGRYELGEELRIIGPRAVASLFEYAPERVLRLFYGEYLVKQAGEFCSLLARQKKPYRQVSEEELTRIAGTPLHQGMVAISKPKPERELHLEALEKLGKQSNIHFVLDGVGNPHNLGAIARSLAFFGFKAIVLTDHPHQAGLSSAAYRVAEGALEVLEVYRARNFWQMMAQSSRQFRLVGTALTESSIGLEAIRQDKRPTFVVLGNEERGLSPQALRQCTDVLFLKGSGLVQSLNVAQTVAILAYELKGC